MDSDLLRDKLIKNIVFVAFVSVFIILVTGCTSKYSNYSYISEKQSSNNLIEITNINNEIPYEIKYYLGSGLTLVSNGEDGINTRYGCINSKGKLVIPIEYLVVNSFNNDVSLVMDDYNKYKYINTEGNIICEQINGYRILSGTSFINGFATVTTNYSKGNYVIDTTGSVILEPTIQGYEYTIVGNTLFNVFKDTTYINTVDITGAVIESLVNPIYVDKNFNIGFYYDESTDKYGFINTKNYQKLSEPVIEKFTFFEYDTTLCTIDGELLLINSSLDVIENLSLAYDGIDAYKYTGFSESLSTLSYENSARTIIIDNIGTLLADTEFKTIYEFNDGIAVCEKDGKYGYINAVGDVIVAPNYDMATQISNNQGLLQNKGEVFSFVKKAS